MRHNLSHEYEIRALDEEAFLRSLGVDDFDIEMVLKLKKEAAKKWKKEY